MWAHYVFNKLYRIISKDKTKYWMNTHKYGTRTPKMAAESLELDRHTGQRLWENSLKKEMGKAEISYEEVEGCMHEEVR